LEATALLDHAGVPSIQPLSLCGETLPFRTAKNGPVAPHPKFLVEEIEAAGMICCV
jgi:hypothetical protein